MRGAGVGQSVAENQDELFALAVGVANRVLGEVPSSDFLRSCLKTGIVEIEETSSGQSEKQILRFAKDDN